MDHSCQTSHEDGICEGYHCMASSITQVLSQLTEFQQEPDEATVTTARLPRSMMNVTRRFAPSKSVLQSPQMQSHLRKFIWVTPKHLMPSRCLVGWVRAT